MQAIRQLENVHRALSNKEPISPEVQENLAAIIADVIAKLQKEQHDKAPHKADTPPNIPPVGGGG